MTKKAMNYQVDHFPNFFKALCQNFKDAKYVTNQELHRKLHPEEKVRLTEDEQFQQALEHVTNMPINKQEHLKLSSDTQNTNNKSSENETPDVNQDNKSTNTDNLDIVNNDTDNDNNDNDNDKNQESVVDIRKPICPHIIEGYLNHQLVINRNQNWYFNDHENEEQSLFESNTFGHGSIIQNDGSIKNSQQGDYVVYLTKLKDRDDSELYQGVYDSETNQIQINDKKPLVKLNHLKDPYVFKHDKKWVMYAINTNDDSLMIYQSRNGFNFRFVKNLTFENIKELSKPQVINIEIPNQDKKKAPTKTYFLSLQGVLDDTISNLIAIGNLDRKGVFEVQSKFQNVDAGNGLNSIYFNVIDNQITYQGSSNYGDIIGPRNLTYKVINDKSYLLTNMLSYQNHDVNALNEIYGNQMQALLLPNQQLNLTIANLEHDLRKPLHLDIENEQHSIQIEYDMQSNQVTIDKQTHQLVNTYTNLDDDKCNLILFLDVNHLTLWFKDIQQIMTIDTQGLNLNQPIQVNASSDETVLFKSQTTIVKKQQQRLINYIDIEKHIIKTIPITSDEPVDALQFIPYGYHYLTGSKKSKDDNIDVVIEPNGLPEAKQSMSENISYVKNSNADKIESLHHKYASVADSKITSMESSANSVVTSTTDSVAQYTSSMDQKYETNVNSLTTSYNHQISHMTSVITSSAYRKVKDSADISLSARIHEVATQQSQQAESMAASKIRTNKAYFKAQQNSLINSAIQSTTASLTAVMNSNVSAATASVSDELNTSYTNQINQMTVQMENLSTNISHLEFENHKLINEKNKNNYIDLMTSDDTDEDEINFNNILNEFEENKAKLEQPKPKQPTKPKFVVPYGMVDLTPQANNQAAKNDNQPDLTNVEENSTTKINPSLFNENHQPTPSKNEIDDSKSQQLDVHSGNQNEVDTEANNKKSNNDNQDETNSNSVNKHKESALKRFFTGKRNKKQATKTELKTKTNLNEQTSVPNISTNDASENMKQTTNISNKVEKPKQSEVEKSKDAEPKIEEPKQSKVEQSKTIETKIEEPKQSEVEQSKAVETKIEEPKQSKVEQSKTIETKIEEPKQSEVEQPKAVETKIEEPKQSKVEKPKAAEPKVEEPKQSNADWASELDAPKEGFLKRFITNMFPEDKNKGKIKYLKLNQDIQATNQNNESVELKASHQPDLKVITMINRNENSKRYTVKYRNDTLKFNAKNTDVENLYYDQLPDGDGLKPVTVEFLNEVYEYDEKNFNGVNPTRMYHPGDQVTATKIVTYRGTPIVQLDNHNFITSNKYEIKLS